MHAGEVKRFKKASFILEEEAEHLEDGKDNLSVRHIQDKLLPAFGMTRGADASCFAGKCQQPLCPTIAIHYPAKL